ncbi:hypothetical protein TIFTF001_038263 [Ficus carica]|uniref:Uncharacterized protein n=1 Tax=Ficus carica TaxID=3494 RepID=A0AA88J9S5_FICCA|nr:hypothetical protein TIFTF001_038263 [Ficus carica]
MAEGSRVLLSLRTWSEVKGAIGVGTSERGSFCKTLAQRNAVFNSDKRSRHVKEGNLRKRQIQEEVNARGVIFPIGL